MEKIHNLIEILDNVDLSLVSVDIVNQFYSEIKELIESIFQEDQSKKDSFLKDLTFFRGLKYPMHIGDENSKIVNNLARNLYDFAQLLNKIKFNY